MKALFNYFTGYHSWKDSYIKRKSVHATFILFLIILSVIIETLLGIFYTGMSLELIIGNSIAILLFIAMLYMIRHGKLLWCGNTFIFAGAMKLLQFSVLERTNQFYLQVLLGMIVGIVIYVKRYQFIAVISMSLSFTLARIPYINYIGKTNPLVTEEYMHQLYQATTGVIIFIVFLLFYDAIVNKEIENTKKVKEATERDMMTNLYNRQMFNAAISDITKQSNCLALLDLDHFKAVNDQFGHQTGDLVLIHFANLLSKHFTDAKVYRWGGEEFAIIKEISDPVHFQGRLESFRELVSKEIFPHNNQMTVSIGCLCAKNYDSEQNLMIDADQALYSAKRSGRNKVVVIK